MEWSWFLDGWIIAIGILSACSCALLGNYLVLRKMSLMGDAISHAVLPGIAIAFLVTASRSAWPMFIGAALVGILTALLTELIQRYGKVEHGAAMGVTFSVLFAIGLILIRRGADHVDLDPGCVLYGNITQIPLDALGEPIPAAALSLAAVLLLNILFVLLFYKELKICAFDPALAKAQGINASVMHYALMTMVAVTTVANFEAVGSILVIAMLIVPPATAYLLSDRLGVMIWLSLVVAVLCAVLGHVLAVWGPGMVGLEPGISLNTAAMMATVAGGLMLLALMLSPRYGVISRLLNRWTLSLRIIREDILGLLYRWEELQPDRGKCMTQRQILEALGRRFSTRRALGTLFRLKKVQAEPAQHGESCLSLTARGRSAATQVVRSHRLWELYLAKHFHLPLDHLHMPAERVEHYITPDLQEALGSELPAEQGDPHGRQIPQKGGQQPNR